MARHTHLLLYRWHTRNSDTTADLRWIARRVEDLDPNVRAKVMSQKARHMPFSMTSWAFPTVSVAIMTRGNTNLFPGRVFCGARMSKVEELQRLSAAGMPVPKWQELKPDVAIRPEEWGPYVIEKPLYGARGANIRIRRTTRAGYIPPQALDPDHRGNRGLLIQEFIYTGEWPNSYRVMTFFGEPILCYRQQTDTRGKPLPHRYGFKVVGGGAAYISNTTEMKVRLVKDADVLELAAKAHTSAFPNVPMLSFDIIRDHDTGRLYVLEANPEGGGSFFSHPLAVKVQRDNDVDFVAQFDGLERMARILSELTPRAAAHRLPFSTPATRQPASSG